MKQTPEQFVDQFFAQCKSPVSPRDVTSRVHAPLLKDEVRTVLLERIAEGSLVAGTDQKLMRARM